MVMSDIAYKGRKATGTRTGHYGIVAASINSEFSSRQARRQ
jgi:hypothetical protein